MKRLLTYLGLLATLLAMPYHAKADNMWLRFWNGTEKVVEMNHDSGGTAWHYDFYTTDDYWKNNGTIYVYPKVNNSIELRSPNSANQGTNVSGAEYEYKKASDVNQYDYKITLPTDYATKKYKVTVWVTNYNNNQSDPYCKVKVTWEKAEFNLRLKSSLDNWVSSTPSESSTGYTWTWNKSTLSSISSGTQIKFKLYDADEDKWYGVSGDTETQATSSWQSCVEGGSNWYVTYTKGNTYTIDAQRVNGTTWQVKVTTNEEDHDYYWVSPQVTNNQKWPYFKLTALRNRSGVNGDGKISDKYFTFTIKNDDLRRYDGTALPDGTKIEWYIARDDDAVWFRPSEDDPTPSESATSLNIGREKDGYSPWDSNIGYRNFNDCKVYAATNTHKFAFNKGANSTKTSDTDYKNTVKSYTFILNAKTSSDATKGNVYFNYAHNSSPVTDGDCYLLGNFRSASESESVCNPGDPKYVDENTNPYGPRKMAQYWYATVSYMRLR